MTAYKKYIVLLLFLLGTACVTINVYFPAAAAENAADKIIQKVYGKDSSKPAPAKSDPQSGLTRQSTNIIAAIAKRPISMAEN